MECVLDARSGTLYQARATLPSLHAGNECECNSLRPSDRMHSRTTAYMQTLLSQVRVDEGICGLYVVRARRFVGKEEQRYAKVRCAPFAHLKVRYRQRCCSDVSFKRR